MWAHIDVKINNTGGSSLCMACNNNRRGIRWTYFWEMLSCKGRYPVMNSRSWLGMFLDLRASLWPIHIRSIAAHRSRGHILREYNFAHLNILWKFTDFHTRLHQLYKTDDDTLLRLRVALQGKNYDIRMSKPIRLSCKKATTHILLMNLYSWSK